MSKLPTPPLPSKRFFQILTPEAEGAIRDRSGDLYEAIIDVLIHANPECFHSRLDVEEVLPLFMWPPSPIESICEDFPHIPCFPTDVMIGGRHIRILVTDPAEYTNLYVSRSSTRIGIANAFGGVDGMRQLRKDFVADGGTAQQFEQTIHETVRRAEADNVDQKRPFWKFW